jgi:starvation-inducible DNA-binding protein
MTINIDLSEKTRKQMSDKLNDLLSNEFVLYTKTLNYHWNVHGPLFGPLHALFQKDYEELLDIVDDVAERVRSLGHLSLGSLKEFLAHATVKENPTKHLEAMAMIKNLLADHEAIIKQIRKDIELSAKLDDMGTNNFLCDLIEKHEKMAWMLRAHLDK